MRLKHVCARGYAARASGADVIVNLRSRPSLPNNRSKPRAGGRELPVHHSNSKARWSSDHDSTSSQKYCTTGCSGAKGLPFCISNSPL